MGKLEFLEVTRNFKSYYKTLRDVNYYLVSDFDNEKLQATSQVLTKLIFGFIRMKGTTFREMTPDQYEKEFQMFQDDFLNIIQISGENNVDFDDFAVLLDELISIANHRTDTLRKIRKTKQEIVSEFEEVESQVIENEVALDNVDALADEDVDAPVDAPADEVEAVSILSNEAEERTDIVEEISTVVQEASNQVDVENHSIEDENDDLEELNESEDIYHFRPRRRRNR